MKQVLAHQLEEGSGTEVIIHNTPDHNHNSSLASQHMGHIIIFGGGLLISIILLIRNHYQFKRQKEKDI